MGFSAAFWVYKFQAGVPYGLCSRLHCDPPMSRMAISATARLNRKKFVDVLMEMFLQGSKINQRKAMVSCHI